MSFPRKFARANFVSSVALTALSVIAAPAQAQDVDAGSRGLEEIVVTAQHRQESLRDVPIAVNAISANALQSIGVSDTAALVQAVPSLNFTRSGPSGIFVIRGVATPNGAAGEEGSTAVYIDDVYMPDLASTINSFDNIQRVEVLNGPQGTLFGRNAVGGLIRVITREPGDEATVNAQMGVGNYDMFTGQLYASTPLSDEAAIDIAFTGQEQGRGFGFNPTLNKRVRTQDFWGLRSKLVARPVDVLKVTIAGDYYHSNDTSATYLWPLDYVPGTGTLTGTTVSQDSLSEFPNITRIRAWGVSGKAELDLGAVTLTSISAYRNLKNTSNFDVEGLPIDLYHIYYPARNRTFQQELRLSSNATDPLSWQVGAFYLHMNTTVDQTQGGSLLRGTTNRIIARGVTDSFSVFGEATYRLTPTTRITGGIRWTRDNRKLPTGYVDTYMGTDLISHRTNPLNSASFENVTFRAALRQDVTDDVNVYASVNKGFKSGQFNLQAPDLPPVKPQTIMAYEVGLKGDLLDRRLRLNLAAFHYDIDDFQIRTTYPNPNGPGVITGLYNAAKVKVDGVDANAEVAMSERLHVTVGASWLNSRFSQFGGPGTGIVAPGYFPADDPGNATGNRTPMAPRFSLNFIGTYTIPFENGSELRFTGGYSHKSSFVFEPDNVLRQPAYDLFNGSIEFRPTENYSIEFYMRNIGNELYNVQMATVAPGYALAGAPRQYGLNFRITY